MEEAEKAIGGINGWTGNTNYIGLISNAIWKGIRLVDVLEDVLNESEHKHIISHETKTETDEKGTTINIKNENLHVEFGGMDGYYNVLPLEMCLDRENDILLTFGMNGEPLPRDHGAPIRLVAPGKLAGSNFIPELKEKI